MGAANSRATSQDSQGSLVHARRRSPGRNGPGPLLPLGTPSRRPGTIQVRACCGPDDPNQPENPGRIDQASPQSEEADPHALELSQIFLDHGQPDPIAAAGRPRGGWVYNSRPDPGGANLAH